MDCAERAPSLCKTVLELSISSALLTIVPALPALILVATAPTIGRGGSVIVHPIKVTDCTSPPAQAGDIRPDATVYCSEPTVVSPGQEDPWPFPGVH